MNNFFLKCAQNIAILTRWGTAMWRIHARPEKKWQFGSLFIFLRHVRKMNFFFSKMCTKIRFWLNFYQKPTFLPYYRPCSLGLFHLKNKGVGWQTFRILLGQIWDTSWIPPDQVSLSQTHRCPDACGSRQKGHVVILDQSEVRAAWELGWRGNHHFASTFHILPTGIHGLCFGSYFSGPLPLRSLLHVHGPLSRVHFGESLVIRLYSEIDQFHLSSEAQCVSHHLPLVDCHNYNA